MKHTLEEVEKMLSGEKEHCSCSDLHIISDLVEEVRKLRKRYEDLSLEIVKMENGLLFAGEEEERIKQENKRLREALENINNSEFIFQMRKIARKALENK